MNLLLAGGGPWDAPPTPPIPDASLALSLCSSLSTTSPHPTALPAVGETEARKERSLIKYDFRPLPQGRLAGKTPRAVSSLQGGRGGAGQRRWLGPRLWCRFWVLTQPLEDQLSLSTPASCSLNQSDGTYISGVGGEGRFVTACARGLNAQSVSSISIVPMSVVQRFIAQRSTVPRDLPSVLLPEGSGVCHLPTPGSRRLQDHGQGRLGQGQPAASQWVWSLLGLCTPNLSPAR